MIGLKPEDPRLVRIPRGEKTAAAGSVVVYRDRWWIADEGGMLMWKAHPKRRHVAAQCNADRRIAVRIRDMMYPWADVELVPLVLVKDE